MLDRLLADFALSATTLNAYLRCPIACFHEHLLRVPSTRNEALHYESAVHESLEHHFKQAQSHPEHAFGSADDLAQAFALRFARNRSELAAAAYECQYHAGQQQLQAYHARWHAGWLPTAVAEDSVAKAVVPGGIPLKGKLDRLDLRADGQGYDVLDYKTGNPVNARAKLKPGTARVDATLADWHGEESLRGGDYWRQAVFYHLLLTHNTELRFRPASVSFDFIQPLETPDQAPFYERKKVMIEPTDEAVGLTQITAVDGAIRAHEFNHGCGDCAWCRLRTSA